MLPWKRHEHCQHLTFFVPLVIFKYIKYKAQAMETSITNGYSHSLRSKNFIQKNDNKLIECRGVRSNKKIVKLCEHTATQRSHTIV